MADDRWTWRIVIVDDDPAIRQMLKRAIHRDTQHEVVTEAASAEEVMRIPKHEGYLFLVDVKMAGDGLVLAKELRRDFRGSRVISISGLDQHLIGEGLRDPAIDGFYSKSAPLSVLYGEIDRVMRSTEKG